jgi:hypothetical protein
MAEQKEQPRPHGDPLKEEIVEPNRAQRESDAAPDAAAERGFEEPTEGTRSTANGIPAGDEADGVLRRKRYDEGAELVSRID